MIVQINDRRQVSHISKMHFNKVANFTCLVTSKTDFLKMQQFSKSEVHLFAFL